MEVIMFKNIRILLAIGLVLLLVISCSKSSSGPKEEPPAIPPASSFIMDFSDFTGPDTSGNMPENGVPNEFILTYQNWGWAYTNVVVWNTVLTVTLAVPVAAFLESFKHEPSQQSNGKWLWSYSFTALNSSYTAKLYGSVSNDGTEWEMYIAKEGVYEDFLWYEGGADLPRTHGTWTVYANPDNATPFLSIEWNRDVNAGTADITYTNITPSVQNNGDYISYGLVGDATYDAFYQIYQKGENHLVKIEWNRQIMYGRIKDLMHFEDEEWHCWDEHLEDIDCPN
jgi:hypothetical protein